MTSPANITALAFSPSGAYCAAASSETIYIWQVTTKLFCILYVGSSVWQYHHVYIGYYRKSVMHALKTFSANHLLEIHR